MIFLKRFSALLIVLGVVAGWGATVSAQSGHYSAASISMGGTGTAYVDSYHANFVNPANLMINGDSKPSTSVGLFGGITLNAGGPLANVSVYNKYFTTGAVVDTESALDAWFGSDPLSTNKLGMEFDMIPVALSVRTQNMGFSLALRNRSLMSGSMNKGYAEILLSGINEERFAEPKPVNFSTKGVFFSEVSAGFSYKILELPVLPGLGENVKIYAGAAPKYIIPHYTSSLDFNSTLQVTSDQVIHDFQYTFSTVGNLTSQFQEFHEASQSDDFDGSLGDFVEPDGSTFTEVQGAGFGFDLGGTVEMDLAGPAAHIFSWIKGPKKLKVGVSVTDIGVVSYSNGAGSFSADETFTWDGIDFSDDNFSDTFTDSVSNQIYLNYEPGNEDEITEELPTKMNLGGHLQLGKLAFALDFQKGLNEAGMNSPRVSMGLGVEYKLFNFVPLRAGYRTGGLISSSLSFGTGLEFRNFEFTAGGSVVPNSKNRGSGMGAAWSGLVFRF